MPRHEKKTINYSCIFFSGNNFCNNSQSDIYSIEFNKSQFIINTVGVNSKRISDIYFEKKDNAKGFRQIYTNNSVNQNPYSLNLSKFIANGFGIINKIENIESIDFIADDPSNLKFELNIKNSKEKYYINLSSFDELNEIEKELKDVSNKISKSQKRLIKKSRIKRFFNFIKSGFCCTKSNAIEPSRVQ